jgi:hypothetical protein
VCVCVYIYILSYWVFAIFACLCPNLIDGTKDVAFKWLLSVSGFHNFNCPRSFVNI